MLHRTFTSMVEQVGHTHTHLNTENLAPKPNGRLSSAARRIFRGPTSCVRATHIYLCDALTFIHFTIHTSHTTYSDSLSRAIAVRHQHNHSQSQCAASFSRTLDEVRLKRVFLTRHRVCAFVVFLFFSSFYPCKSVQHNICK